MSNFEYSNIELEKLFIKLLCLSIDNIELAINKITVNNFTNNLCKDIYFEIVEQYKKFNSIITTIELKNKLQNKFEDKDILNNFIDSIFNTNYNKDSNIESIVSLLLEKTKARTLAQLIQKLGNNVNQGKIRECDSIINDYLQYEDNNAIFSEIDGTNHIQNTLMNIIKERENPTKFSGIKTNFNCIDTIIQGLKKSELMCFVAKSGGGKTTAMNNVVASNLLLGKRILYFIIESPVKQYEINLSAYLANVNAKEMHENKVNNDVLKKVDEVWRFVKESGGKVIFIDAPQHLNTVALQMEIKRAKRKYKSIDLVIIDYMQIMENGSQNPYDWAALTNVSKQLKAIARAEDVPIISALQEVKKNEDEKKKQEHSQADIAYAKGITDNADYIIKIYQSDMDKMANRLTFHFLKARRAAFISSQGYVVRCNLAQQIIDIDSERKLKVDVGLAKQED